MLSQKACLMFGKSFISDVLFRVQSYLLLKSMFEHTLVMQCWGLMAMLGVDDNTVPNST